MCGMKEAFVDIDESYKGNITFGRSFLKTS